MRELERTVRTVMVMNLNLRADEGDVFEFFGPRVGALNDIKIIKDKNTKRSKGIAYVEFQTVESAIAALSLNGQLLLNMPVLVKPSEAEKNLQWEAQQQAKQNQQNQNAAAGLLTQIGAPAHEPIKLQILNLHPEVKEDDLQELFGPFGTINYLKVVRDATGRSTGEAYVQYTDKPMADKAATHFNNFDIGGYRMTVQVAPVYAMAAMQAAPTTVLPPPPGYDPAALAMGMMGGPQQAQQQPQPQVQGQGEVDDLEEAETRSGFRLNAQSRVALMSRLANSAGLQAPPPLYPGAAPPAAAAPPAVAPAAPAAPVLHVPPHVLEDQGLLGPASPIPTPCLLLKNMFTEADKAEPNWQADVIEDVTGEASKFGQVVHCYPDPNSVNGNVYVKFATPQAAEAASRAFHGRYYSGRQIVCSYQFLQPYVTYFHVH
uniref:RRM domain-containing protein n=2 Tax=Dunaliella tertiolecta TaxID=3047 RepID=A0A7S3VKM0_DUNTE